MELESSYDPYDLWAIPFLGKIKSDWSDKKPYSVVAIPIIGLAEVLIPITTRKVIGAKKNLFPNSLALEYFYSSSELIDNYLYLLLKTQSPDYGWGLPFLWYSKNGTYPAGLPFITHSLYPMEALLDISTKLEGSKANLAYQGFTNSWKFLSNLHVMKNNNDELSLSYAPINEPRMVVNANSYSAAAYALHAIYGSEENKITACDRATKLINWIIAQQQANGSWYYYADNSDGNFIDCFHSCFIIKNLIKVQKLLPHLREQIQPAIVSGWGYINENLYDAQHGLCRRFSQRSHHDPFRWDLYDQAEYLGLLVDFERYEQAEAFAQRVERKFSRNGQWYCRIDILGRRWGKDFLRWGIAPYHYHKHRLQLATGRL